jgi:hypothetical protein
MNYRELKGVEKVLWKAHYEFGIEILKLSEEKAKETANEKIVKKRALAKHVHRH